MFGILQEGRSFESSKIHFFYFKVPENIDKVLEILKIVDRKYLNNRSKYFKHISLKTQFFKIVDSVENK